MNITKNIKLDGAPILVFALIVGSKTFALWSYLADKQNLWILLKILGVSINTDRVASTI